MSLFPKLASYRDCTGCMLCADTCPKAAIRFEIDDNGFWTPQINPELCIGCKLCERKCATVRKAELRPASPQPCMGHAVSKEVRQRSTSGGIFYVLAEQAILKHAAIVYGAVCEGRSIRHKAARTLEELTALQGSKYAQSNTCGIYKEVKTQLAAGRFVLFSGTPCQVQALHTYLGKEHDKLLTVDLICHGVPSYKLIERHLAVNGGESILQFRAKSYGWGRDSYITMKRGDDTVTVTDRFRNLFYNMFQTELAFRPNCYKCRFNSVHRAGDITIGDYWAARHTEAYDPLGVSTVLPNTAKGRDFLNTCTDICLTPIFWEQALASNPRLVTDRREYLNTAFSARLGSLYRRLPSALADRLLGTLHSKRRPLSFLWRKYLAHRRAAYQPRYEAALAQTIHELSERSES